MDANELLELLNSKKGEVHKLTDTISKIKKEIEELEKKYRDEFRKIHRNKFYRYLRSANNPLFKK